MSKRKAQAPIPPVFDAPPGLPGSMATDLNLDLSLIYDRASNKIRHRRPDEITDYPYFPL